MKTTENLSENVRVRLAPEQKEIISNIAKEKGISLSDAIRHALFDEKSSSPYATAITHNLIKNEMMNQIQSMDIPKNVKTKVMKGMNTIGQHNL